MRDHSVSAYSTALAKGKITPSQLLEAAIAAASDVGGEGARVFIETQFDIARADVKRLEQLSPEARKALPLYGLPISIKDLFDQKGKVTCSGSLVRRDSPPAEVDAQVMQRLRAAGAVIVGRTNMTEFAYSGLGLNPHYGTPLNPCRRTEKHIPGGSSSGAAVSVTDNMAIGSIGSDTGGSVRIPAAFCGLVGFKPTQDRVSREGVFPLSKSLDSIGPLARTVDCCARLDAVISGNQFSGLDAVSVKGLRIGMLSGVFQANMDAHVQRAFKLAVGRFTEAGAAFGEADLSVLAVLDEITARGGIAAPECLEAVRELYETRADAFDPRVRSRITGGQKVTQEQYREMLELRLQAMSMFAVNDDDFDVYLCPTVPITAPRFDDLVADEDYYRINMLVLRNPSFANVLDRPAISLPCGVADDALPVGLMLIGKRGQDRALLNIAHTLEPLVAGQNTASEF